MPGFSEIVATNATRVGEAYPFRIAPHLLDYVVNTGHLKMISLLISPSRPNVNNEQTCGQAPLFRFQLAKP
jgi:hypothetical protein